MTAPRAAALASRSSAVLDGAALDISGMGERVRAVYRDGVLVAGGPT